VTAETTANTNATGSQEFVIILATRIVLLVAGVLNQSLMAYTLSPEGRGAYEICALFGLLLGTLLTPGADRGSQYFVMAQQMSLSQGVSVALTISLVGSGLAVALAIPLVPSELAFFEKASSQSFFLVLVLIPIAAFSNAMALQLDGLRRFVRMAVFLSIQALVAVIVLLVLVWGLGLGVDGAILAFAMSNLVLIVLCILDLRRHCGLVWEWPTRAGLSSALSYGFRNHVARVGAISDARLGSLLLGFTASRVEIGLFSAGSSMMLRVFMIPYSISAMLQPRIAIDEAGQPELTAFCARVAWWITGVVLVILLAVATPLVRILLSEAFLPAVPLIWILALGVFAYSGADILMSYFRGINQPEMCSWAIFLGVGANVVAFSALFQALGIKAAAWGTTIGLLVRSAFLLIVYCRTSRMKLRSVCMLKPDDVTYLWNAGRLLLRRAWP